MDKLSLTSKEEKYVRKSYNRTRLQMTLNQIGPYGILKQIIKDRKEYPENHVRHVWLKTKY